MRSFFPLRHAGHRRGMGPHRCAVLRTSFARAHLPHGPLRTRGATVGSLPPPRRGGAQRIVGRPDQDRNESVPAVPRALHQPSGPSLTRPVRERLTAEPTSLGGLGGAGWERSSGCRGSGVPSFSARQGDPCRAVPRWHRCRGATVRPRTQGSGGPVPRPDVPRETFFRTCRREDTRSLQPGKMFHVERTGGRSWRATLTR